MAGRDLDVQEIEMRDHIQEGQQLLRDTQQEPVEKRYSLRGNSMDYSYRFGMEDGNLPKGMNITNVNVRRRCIRPKDGFGTRYGYAAHMLFLQMSAKKGLKLFGERASDAIKAEFEQLIHGKKVFIPIMMSSLSREERRKALRAITLIDHKRSGQVKGRTVANGSTQRLYIPQDEACSPTVATEAVLITAVIDGNERRIVGIYDVSGAFLQAYMDDFVVVVFEDDMVDLMVETEPSFGEYVYITSKGKKLLYVQLRKAMYGCLKAARLWWKEFSTHLTEQMGFTLNPYENCVANKDIEGSQCTIIWHVDDLKISHRSKEVVKEVVKQIEGKYGTMTGTIGTKHTYVGMDFEFLESGTVTVSMNGYIEDAISEYPGKVVKEAKTPASQYLFEVNNECPKLDESRAKVFHRIVAMLLFVRKRARPDIQVAIAFLSTRTTKSDEDDWKKLARLISYLKALKDLVLHLSADEGTPVIKWWVDASYAVHDDMRSHTGAMMIH